MQFGETFVNFVWPSIFMKHSRVGGGAESICIHCSAHTQAAKPSGHRDTLATVMKTGIDSLTYNKSNLHDASPPLRRVHKQAAKPSGHNSHSNERGIDLHVH